MAASAHTSCADEWNVLESDVGVFRELLELNKVVGVDVVDVYDMESFRGDCSSRDQLVFGYVLLLDKSKYQKEMSQVSPDAEPNTELWFARQVVNNSCATHALLSIVMNLDCIKSTLLEDAKQRAASVASEDSAGTKKANAELLKLQTLLDDVALGPQLEAFREFTSSFDAKTRGLSVGNSDELRRAHNSFSNDSQLLLQATKPDRKRKHVDDPRTRLYHFSTYICVLNRKDAMYDVYEIDSLYNDAPLRVLRDKTYDGAQKQLISFLTEKLQKFGQNDLFFSLMALVSDPLPALQRRLSAAKEAGDSGEEVLLQEAIADALERLEGQKKENARRRTNYMPFLIQLLKSLAQNGTLAAVVESSGLAGDMMYDDGGDVDDEGELSAEDDGDDDETMRDIDEQKQ